jgi:hypothetical protein
MLHGMQRTLTFPPADSSEVDSNTAFNVLIAYEDFETGKHAKKTYDFLVENLGKECHLTNQMWKFDVLSIPKLREIAVRDATLADIILISCYGDPLPEHVVKWTESWLQQGSGALALVALFEKGEGHTSDPISVRGYLADVARRGHMEFFAQPDEWPGRNRLTDSLLLHRAPGVTERTLTSLAGVTRRDVTPRWGINE